MERASSVFQNTIPQMFHITSLVGKDWFLSNEALKDYYWETDTARVDLYLHRNTVNYQGKWSKTK